MTILIVLLPFPWLILLVTLLIAGSMADDRIAYLKTAGTAASRFLNTLITGDPLETICARAGRWQEDGKLKGVIVAAILDWLFSSGHCRRSRERFLALFPPKN